MDKILVKINVPLIEKKYDMWIPINKTVYYIIMLLTKSIYDINNLNDLPLLYNKYSGLCYDLNVKIKNTDIKNGTELILI